MGIVLTQVLIQSWTELRDFSSYIHLTTTNICISYLWLNIDDIQEYTLDILLAYIVISVSCNKFLHECWKKRL